MNRDVTGDLAPGDDELEPRISCRGDLARLARGAHDENAGVRLALSQLESFVDRGHAESSRAGAECGVRGVRGAVAVAVRLDDRPELGPRKYVEEPPRVVADRAEVDRDLAPVHRRPA